METMRNYLLINVKSLLKLLLYRIFWDELALCVLLNEPLWVDLYFFLLLIKSEATVSKYQASANRRHPFTVLFSLISELLSFHTTTECPFHDLKQTIDKDPVKIAADMA